MSSLSFVSADVLQVGDCEVVLSLREIHVPGAKRPRRVTPKAMGVLRVLASSPGQVVTREQLLANVWPHTLPTDDVVTQAVTQLRKAFNDGVEARDYIETIPKGGYRLLVPVSGHLEPPVAPAAAHAPRTRPWLPWLPWTGLALVAVVVIVAVLAGAGKFNARQSSGVVERDAVVLASPGRPYHFITASTGFKITPTLSPDGSMVAYAFTRLDGTGLTLMVQTTDNAPARVLVEREPGGSDRLPAWSPDGRRIAFVRQGGEADCRVMVVPSTGGQPREATRCERGDLPSFSWMPDGRGLVFGSMDTDEGRTGLRTLDLESGRWQTLAYGSNSRDFDHMPRYSPDGRWIVFARNPQMGQLWKVPAEGGHAEPLLRDNADIRGWDWWPDGSAVVFGRRVDSEHRLYRVPLDGGVAEDLGIDDAQNPTVAAKAWTLGFVRRESAFGIYRVDLADAGASVQERLFPSSGRDSQPMISPDGTQLLFSSDRSGDLRLWWADLEQEKGPKPLDGFQPETLQSADWAHDGRSALVVGRDASGPGLFEVHPESGRIVSLSVPAGVPLLAAHAGGSRLLVGTAVADGGVRLTHYDRGTSPWRTLGVLENVSRVRVDGARQRVLFTRLTEAGLWEADLSLAPESVRQLHEAIPRRWLYRNWDVDGEGRAFYTDIERACASMLGRLAAGRTADRWCVDPARAGATNGISVARDGRVAYVSLAVRDGTEIGLMPLRGPGDPSQPVD